MFTPTGMDDEGVVRGIELRLDMAVAGLKSSIPQGVTNLILDGVSYPVADLVKHADEVVKPWKKVREARMVIREATQGREDDRERALKFLADLKAALVPHVGRESQELLKFGFKPQKKLSQEKKAVRAAKARETREKKKQPSQAANPARPENGGSSRTAV
ncbi:MAG: hypothetical protein ACAI25_05670 [Planctomycetota bacterium]